MRISDWISDVCSSDLQFSAARLRLEAERRRRYAAMRIWHPGGNKMAEANGAEFELKAHEQTYNGFISLLKWGAIATAIVTAIVIDRKSVVSGKSVVVRVDLGCRRIIKKKKKKK